ncbi:MAG: zf-HC2 domain-containing protein [Solirubrobacteraceae bacterium]
MISEHRFAAARLSAYQDGALPDAELRRVRAHLPGCRRCRDELDELAAMTSRLRVSNAAPPEGLADRVIAHLDAERAAPRLSIVEDPVDAPVPRAMARAARWAIAREHLSRTLPLAFLVGLAVTLLKDLQPLLADGFTTQNCAVCGLNFVLAFVLLNAGIMLAYARRQPG